MDPRQSAVRLEAGAMQKNYSHRYPRQPTIDRFQREPQVHAETSSTQRRITMKRIVIMGEASGLMIFLLAVSVQPALAFTGGNTIRILSGLPPGGGHDIEGRLIARWIGKYLPAKPRSIISINVPGALA